MKEYQSPVNDKPVTYFPFVGSETVE